MTKPNPSAISERNTEMSGTEYGLYFLTVIFWGSSWIGVKFQVLSSVAPMPSVAYRFIIAAIVMFAWVFLTKRQVWFSLRDHLVFMVCGGFLFSTNYVLFYFATQYVVSGLLALVFSMATFMNIFNTMIFYRERPQPQVVLGALVGICGLTAIFWREVSGAGFASNTLFALGLGVLGTLCFSLGNMVSTYHQRRGISIISASAHGMAFGAVAVSAIVFLTGQSWSFDTSSTYVLSLIYLSLFPTVIGFAAYLTLVGRIGANRAGYATVLFPAIALAFSTFYEGYVWTPAAIAGLVLIMLGNYLVLRARKTVAKPQRPTSPSV